jgi:DsbC/DsbD-like thiol-disulfide interchange protein
MKYFKLFILCLFTFPFSFLAQESGMVSWMFNIKKIDDQLYEFTAKAVIPEGWHVYAQDSGEGSVPTKFTFTKNPQFNLEGKVIEKGEVIKKKNNLLDSELRYYMDSVAFVQRVKILRKPQDDKNTAVLKGKVEFMVCNESMCLPPEEITFAVELK